MTIKKVHIATSRDIGRKCREWASLNRLADWELTDSIEDCDVFISVMYDKLIDESFIASKKACFNFHPGILPKYRGSGAYSWSIINEEDFTGVTLHKIDVSIDHGNIIYIGQFPILRHDTAGTLFEKAEETMFFMFQSWFHKLLKEDYISSPQNEVEANIYYHKDLNKAKDLTKYYRAFTFPG